MRSLEENAETVHSGVACAPSEYFKLKTVVGQMENRTASWDSQESCSFEDSVSFSLAPMSCVDENARMSFYDDDMDEEMDTIPFELQSINEDSGLGTISRGKTVSLTSMFSQIRTSPILEVSTENLAIDLSDHEKETISSLDQLERKVESKSPRRFALQDIKNTTPHKSSPRRIRKIKIDRKRSYVQFKNAPICQAAISQLQNRKRRGDFLFEKRVSSEGIPMDAQPIRRIQSTSVLETSANSDCLSPESVEHCTLRIVEKPQIEDTAFHSINGKTLSILLNSMSREQFLEKFILIDCRYPFEYDGGHVRNALNVYQPERIKSIFYPSNPAEFKQINKRIPIFYCEFSQKRGPKMARELRRCDRQANESLYPHLDYPEVYILDRGYRNFFATIELNAFCEPQGYIPMLHSGFSQDLLRYNQHRKQR